MRTFLQSPAFLRPSPSDPFVPDGLSEADLHEHALLSLSDERWQQAVAGNGARVGDVQFDAQNRPVAKDAETTAALRHLQDKVRQAIMQRQAPPAPAPDDLTDPEAPRG